MFRSMIRCIAFCFCSFITSISFAQQSDSTKKQLLLLSATETLNTLRTYEWTMKTDISARDKKYPVLLYNVKWNKDGSMLLTEKAGAAPLPDDPAVQLVQKLAALISKYTGPTDAQLTAFYKTSGMQTDSGNMIELSGGDYMIKEDKVTMDIDKIIFMVRGLTFTTVIDEDDVMGTIEYTVDNNGLKHPSKVKVDIPAKRMSVIFNNTDFVKR
ncbi:hypothetical protein [Pollutibacter soli]|uniref:hypothetical protein n=1 Tax=Pollutibacter soli TaxID=3034157 RepID=UPI003013CBAB